MKARAMFFSVCIFILFSIAGCQLKETDLPSSSLEEQISVSESTSMQSSSASSLKSMPSSAPSESSVSSASASQDDASVVEPDNRSVAPSVLDIHPDPFGLMGEGEIALFVTISNSQKTLELSQAMANDFLSKINLSSLSLADMQCEITPPDEMIGQTGTDGNYISIGMPHTNTLFIYDIQTQALLLNSSETKYYDMPSDMYDIVKSALNG